MLIRHHRAALLALSYALVAPGTALAHPFHDAGDLAAGMMHPLSGADHVLMIVAVSAWAALLPGRGRVMVAACLSLFVGLGALLPVGNGVAVEIAIAITVMGAGMLLAMGRRLPLGLTTALTAAFAIVHGIAHGAEAPGGAGVAYVAGLMFSTGVLALSVSFVGARLHGHRHWWRAAGIASALAGVMGIATIA